MSLKKLSTHLLLSSTLFSMSLFAISDQDSSKRKTLPRDEIFPPEDGKIPPLKGKISKGRYFAPEGAFSCQAYDFGRGSYVAQDGLFEFIACVSFYSPVFDFKKAEILLLPALKKGTFGEKELKKAFDDFGIKILEVVDNAQGIKVLKEEMLEDGAFFTVISIDRMSVLSLGEGHYPSSTRGYLIFQENDKLVVLTNQLVTRLGKKHEPEKHVEKLKQEILEFRNTFEFGAIPQSVVEYFKSIVVE